MGGGGGCFVSNIENQCADCNFCCVGDMEVPVQHEPNISDELNETRSRIQERAKVPEQELADYVNQSITGIKGLLNSFAADEFDVENLDALTKKFVDELNGFVSMRVNKRLIPEDKELVVILAEPDAIKRKENFDAFNERLFRNALKDLLTATEEFYCALEDSLKRDISAL